MVLRNRDHILVCTRWGIGDLVLQTGALRSLRAELPTAHLVLLGARPASELLDGEAIGDEVVAYQEFGFEHWFDEGSGAGRTALMRWLEARRFDAIVEPPAAPTGARDVIWALDVPTYESDSHVIRDALRDGAPGAAALAAGAAAGWGVAACPTRQPALVPDDYSTDADRFLERRGVREPPIAVAPAASHPLKRWPASRFASVLECLGDRAEDATLIFEAPHDPSARRLAERLRGRGARAWLVPPQHLRLTAALLARSRLLLCNDTGLMHVAAAVDTPVVAPFGPTDPAVYGPHHPSSRTLASAVACEHRQRASMDPPACWSAGRCLLGHRSCIDSVDVSAVSAAVEGVGQPGLRRQPDDAHGA